MAGALEVRVLAVSVARMLRGEEQQVVAARADRVLESDEHLVEERVLQIGVALAGLEEDADHVRALGLEAARRRGGRVVELARQPHDPLARLCPDVGVAVQRARHSADRDAARLGQPADSDAFLGHLRKRFWTVAGDSLTQGGDLSSASGWEGDGRDGWRAPP